ncbi:methyltransferase domain-containing protein [Terrilactibacillus sp. BCM23-1]|uniref:Methyltransferase domain-containing protein n=1 Tax=Terrilactibacillus tamarindi TaxID=2599694 RepID=A0A6N8CQJ6_9BACI|nr:class I SAM-dependent methyltransferase [Terrilactibacillus tamarindi]MTT32489.1 methyltransferase domain-containing protein [Terrilactibacillus tamarindi]
MAYDYFAQLYDELMNDAPYDQWLDFFYRTLNDNQLPSAKILDVGCGTGELALKLIRDKFDVTGVDLSENMLAMAKEKAEHANLSFPLFQQDMRELELGSTFDLVLIFCDSLNYLETLDDVKQTFQRVYEHLNEGGALLFDVHSLYKIHSIFINHTFALNDENIAYIWESFPGEEEHSVYHDLTFFTKTGDDLFTRHDETHYQRTFDIETYSMLLKETGFQCLRVCADFTNDPPTKTSERIFFIAKKNS